MTTITVFGVDDAKYVPLDELNADEVVRLGQIGTEGFILQVMAGDEEDVDFDSVVVLWHEPTGRVVAQAYAYSDVDAVCIVSEMMRMSLDENFRRLTEAKYYAQEQERRDMIRMRGPLSGWQIRADRYVSDDQPVIQINDVAVHVVRGSTGSYQTADNIARALPTAVHAANFTNAAALAVSAYEQNYSALRRMSVVRNVLMGTYEFEPEYVELLQRMEEQAFDGKVDLKKVKDVHECVRRLEQSESDFVDLMHAVGIPAATKKEACTDADDCGPLLGEQEYDMYAPVSRREALREEWRQRIAQKSDVADYEYETDPFVMMSELYDDIIQDSVTIVLILKRHVRRAALCNGPENLDFWRVQPFLLGQINVVLTAISELDIIVRSAPFDPVALLDLCDTSFKNMPTPLTLRRMLSKAAGTPY